MNLDNEVMQIRQAEEHLELAELRIQHQERIIQELRKDGHDTFLALKLLDAMRETRQVMRGHKACVIASIELIKGLPGNGR